MAEFPEEGVKGTPEKSNDPKRLRESILRARSLLSEYYFTEYTINDKMKKNISETTFALEGETMEEKKKTQVVGKDSFERQQDQALTNTNHTDTHEDAGNNKKEATEIAIIDEQTIRDKIYTVRGVKVMLDFELAEIYGYTTKAFNQQVKNNLAKFDDDFRFQLTIEEIEELSRSNYLTAMQKKGKKGGRTSLPWCFTESGIYMLMTVLRGDLATRQSKALIRTFRAMKDYIVENRSLIGQHDYLRLSMQVSDTQQTVHAIQEQIVEHEARFSDVFEQLSDTVKKSELSPFLLDFSRTEEKHEYLLLNGEPAKAAETYIDLYSQAKQTVYIVDNYIDIKTLRLLQGVQPGVSVIVFSDNLRNFLHARDYADFQVEFPEISVSFREAGGIMHDRFIVLDFDTTDERMFHCGASSKDAGVKRMTSITEYREKSIRTAFHTVVEQLLLNPELVLK